jgi:hypothetical protein
MRSRRTPNGTRYLLKDGVKVEGTSSQIAILDAAGEAYAGTGQRLVVTSGNEGYRGDGVHTESSEHYESDALDLRIWNLDDPARVAAEIADILGPDFDVVYGEEVGHSTHIHVEEDPA